jgi:hypothetical protein
MSTLAKLLGFAAVLGLVFGGAALAGSSVDPRPGETTERADAMGGGHGEEGEMAVKAVRGLAVSDGGLTLKLARRTAARGERFELAFRIADRRGRTVRAFDVEHTKRMHVIVVRRDMTGFQHLHPTQRADGSWSVPVTLRQAGSYRVFADFSSRGETYTLADDISVDGNVRSRPLPAPANSTYVDGFKVQMTDDLAFSISRDGRPVTPEPYLGAKGHLVALREGDLAFLHVHPDENRLRFEADLPPGARYRLFLQFQVDGRVHTAEVTR